MAPEVAEYIAGIIPGGAVLDNNTYLKAENQAGDADISVIKVNATDDTVINSSASDDLIIQLEDDANRVVTLDAASDTALAVKFGDGGTTAAQNLSITGGTSAGDDDQQICISGGGACADLARGSYISVEGEEDGGGGDVVVGAVDDVTITATDDLVLQGQGSGDLITLAGGGTTPDLTIADTQITVASGTFLGLGVATLAAAGTDNTNAGAVAQQVTYVTASDGTKGVILPASTGTGNIYVVHNTVNAQNLKVYPDASGTINGGTATTGNVVVAGEETGFFIDVATNTYFGGVAVDF
jgi:hypothetical protein